MTTATAPVNETNGLYNGFEYHQSVDYANEMTLRQVADAKGHISRVRILADYVGGYGYMADVSYIHATLPNGTTVPVRVTGNCQCVALNRMKGAFIEWAKEEGVYAKALGLLDDLNWSVLK